MSSDQQGEAAPTAQSRKVCWEARDSYFKCLDAHDEANTPCSQLREAFEQACPSAWVKHFCKRRSDDKQLQAGEGQSEDPPAMTILSRVFSRGMRKSSPLPAKHGNKDYYKGNRSGSMGQLTKHGAFILDESKVRNWMIPDLTDFKLKAYVSQTSKPVSGAIRTVQQYIDAATKTTLQ